MHPIAARVRKLDTTKDDDVLRTMLFTITTGGQYVKEQASDTATSSIGYYFISKVESARAIEPDYDEVTFLADLSKARDRVKAMRAEAKAEYEAGETEEFPV